MYRQYSLGEQKQWETEVQVKEIDPTCSRFLFFPCKSFKEHQEEICFSVFGRPESDLPFSPFQILWPTTFISYVSSPSPK